MENPSKDGELMAYKHEGFGNVWIPKEIMNILMLEVVIKVFCKMINDVEIKQLTKNLMSVEE